MNTERMAAKRELIVANRKAKNELIKLIKSIVKDFNLDEDGMNKRINFALSSEYGPINGLINLVVAIAKWPAEPGDGSMVATNRQLLESKHGLDLLLLDDIDNFRGNHTFVSKQDLEIIASKEPDYENYTDYCAIFLEDLGVQSYKATIEESIWNYREQVAVNKADQELAEKREELERYKSMMNPTEEVA